MRGNYNDNDQPIIEIEIKGATGVSKKIDAIVDSGFNGYLQISFVRAFPLGLVLKGIEPKTLADGKSMSSLVCAGEVCIDGKCIPTTIDIEQSEIVLLGTKLLKELGKTFFLDATNGKVEIGDCLIPHEED